MREESGGRGLKEIHFRNKTKVSPCVHTHLDIEHLVLLANSDSLTLLGLLSGEKMFL